MHIIKQPIVKKVYDRFDVFGKHRKDNGKISGRVLLSGQAVANIIVFLYVTNDSIKYHIASTRTDENGAYEFTGLAPNVEHVVQVNRTDYTNYKSHITVTKDE